tara:strand:+ start:1127 stop:1309 length:183 start_codon:yes stop_codon:yes gene_type:complete
MLLTSEHREKDLFNDMLVQLFPDLLSEELLHKTGTHYFFTSLLLKGIIKRKFKFTNQGVN